MLFQKKESVLLAVANGKAIELAEVPDDAFASGMLGVGFAIVPSDGTIYAPASGVVESIADSKHAYTIQSDDGLDLLVHIGIDTVELKGEGFLPMVTAGDRVKAGDVLARVDLNLLRGRNFPTAIPVLISNSDAVFIKKTRTGNVIGGEDAVLDYRLLKK